VFVGAPTVIAIEGNKIAPWFADYYLGRTGFASQQTEQAVPRNRPDNLFEPLPGDFGAHGIFNRDSEDSVAPAWLTARKGTTALAGAAVFGALAFALRRRFS
jgi:hypothetical protein